VSTAKHDVTVHGALLNGAALVVDGLTTGYLKAPVLRDVSLLVDGEIVAVLGANGAGKTTLLRAISGALRAWSGAISISGRDLGKSSPWDRVNRGVAHVPEGRHVFTAMSVRDNLEVAGLAAGKGAGYTTNDVYDLFPRLGERRHQLAGSMSGGEQQMLAIGRALMTDPKILLVDEMSAGLAPVTAQLLVESLRTIHRDLGVSMLLVEQSPHLIEGLVDRVYVLDRGQITAAGTVEDIGGSEGLASVYLAAH
jgi:branched-chain amino acid transport system ATP-binding protein